MRAIKVPHLKGGRIGPRRETCVYWGGPTVMVPCFLDGNIYIKRNPRVWRVRKCILLSGAKAPLTFAGRQSIPSQGRRYRGEKANFRILGWTYRNGTVFAPYQDLYPKEATGMVSPEMHFPRRCKNCTYLCGPVKVHRRKGGRIGPRREICVYWGGPTTMVPCLH